jgi:hypothetical protein
MKTRPLLAIAAAAAIAIGISACTGGGSGAQYSYDPSNSGYSNTGTNPNESGSLYWQNQAQQNGTSAIDDMGPGGAADPVDDGNSVSYSGDGSGD